MASAERDEVRVEFGTEIKGLQDIIVSSTQYW